RPATLGGRPDPDHLERSAYLALGRRVASATARANGARGVAVSFPDDGGAAPVRIAVRVDVPVRAGQEHELPVAASAQAELVPGAGMGSPAPAAGAGEYPGP